MMTDRIVEFANRTQLDFTLGEYADKIFGAVPLQVRLGPDAYEVTGLEGTGLVFNPRTGVLSSTGAVWQDIEGGIDMARHNNGDWVVVEAKKPQRISAAQIHAEVYAAAKVLEPKPFSEPEPVLSERIKTLIRMGFANHKEVLEYEEQAHIWNSKNWDYQRTRSEYDRAIGYAFRYPNYKFITEGALHKVLHKYGLQLEFAEMFIGKIPEKNILDMKRFLDIVQIEKEDLQMRQPTIHDYRTMGTHPREETRFKIAAPPEMFIERLESTVDFLLDDPIVLKPVKGGYLIVTAWGDEASDPDIINERNN